MLPELNAARESEIVEAWLKETGELLLVGVGCDNGFLYYGNHSGYDILFVFDTNNGETEVHLGSYIFSHNTPFFLVGYLSGSFYSVTQMYDNGIIRDRSIASMHDIHNIYQE